MKSYQPDKMLFKSQIAKCHMVRRIFSLFLIAIVLFDSYVPLIEAGDKGRDIIITDGKVILKGGKKKGNIIITNGSHGQGKYKYKKKYIDYGGYWK